MSPRLLRSCAIVVVFVVATAACSGDDDPAASPGETLPTTTTIGVHEVPDEITVDYVQRVMDEIDASWGGMFRQLKLDGELTDSTRSWIQSLHGIGAETVEVQLQDMVEGNFATAAESPGDPSTIVRSVLSVGSECVVVETQRFYAEVLNDAADESELVYVALGRREPGDDRKNRTAWALTDEMPTERSEVERFIEENPVCGSS